MRMGPIGRNTQKYGFLPISLTGTGLDTNGRGRRENEGHHERDGRNPASVGRANHVDVWEKI